MYDDECRASRDKAHFDDRPAPLALELSGPAKQRVSGFFVPLLQFEGLKDAGQKKAPAVDRRRLRTPSRNALQMLMVWPAPPSRRGFRR